MAVNEAMANILRHHGQVKLHSRKEMMDSCALQSMTMELVLRWTYPLVMSMEYA
jgi:hypothetical protein